MPTTQPGHKLRVLFAGEVRPNPHVLGSILVLRERTFGQTTGIVTVAAVHLEDVPTGFRSCGGPLQGRGTTAELGLVDRRLLTAEPHHETDNYKRGSGPPTVSPH